MVKFKNYIFLFFLGLLFSLNANAQIDKTFWFAAPNITRYHDFPHNSGGTSSSGSPGFKRDRDIRLVISTFGQSATVTIKQPANNSFNPIIVNINANSKEMV